MRSLWFIRSTIVSLFIVALGVCVRPASAQNVTGAAVRESTELEKLRLELERLRTELEVIRGQYEQRLQALEDRLKTAEPGTSETAKQQPPPPAQVPPPTPPPVDQPPPQTLPAGSSKVFNPDMSVNGNFVGVAGKNALQRSAVAAAHRGRGVVPGHRRSVCTRRLLPRRRSGGSRGRGRVHHLHLAAEKSAVEGRKNARAVRQGEHRAHARDADRGSAARHRQSRRRRRGLV